MQSLFFKMGLVLTALVGWVVYDRWDDWSTTTTASVSAVSTKMKSSLPSEPPTNIKTKVYKWQDAQGRWQFSNEPPKTQAKVTTQNYNSNENVMQRLTPEDIALVTRKSKKEDAPTGGSVFSHLPAAVNSARDAQNSATQQEAQMQRALQQQN